MKEDISTEVRKHSQNGNAIFPRWELSIPSLGILPYLAYVLCALSTILHLGPQETRSSFLTFRIVFGIT